MRRILLPLLPACLVFLLAGCATPVAKPLPKAGADEVRQQCLARMYSSRSRGAVHWQIYENCLKEHS